MRQIVGTSDTRAECIGFGHAVTKLRAAVFHFVVHFANKRRWRRRTAAAHCAQAGGVVLIKCWRVDQVPTLCWYANEVGDLLALNHLERLFCVPLVHDREFQSGNETTHHHGHATGYVKQRHNQNERRRYFWAINVFQLCSRHGEHSVASGECHQRRNDGTMRRDGTLRAPCRARCVQNCCVVVGINVGTWVRCTWLDHYFPFVNICWQRLFGASNKHFHAVLRAAFGSSVVALLVTNEHRCARVDKCEVHLVFCPPRVHRHVDRAYRNNCRKRHHPFRVVAHCNGNAVTFFHTVCIDEQVGKPIYLIHRFGKRPRLTLVHKKRFVAVAARARKNLSKMSGCIFEHLHFHATNVGVDQFKNLSRRSYCCVRLLPRHCHVVIPRYVFALFQLAWS